MTPCSLFSRTLAEFAIFVLAAGPAADAAIFQDHPPRQPSRRVVPDPPSSDVEFRQVGTLEGTTGPVYSLAWSPDGSTLASAGYRNVLLWDPATGSIAGVLSGHENYIWGVAWSPDGETLASASADGTVKLWRVSDLTEIGSAGNSWTMCVAWSPDGNLLATGNIGGRVQIRDAATLDLVREWSVGSWIIATEWSADSGRLLVGDLAGRVSLYDTNSGELLRRFRTPLNSNDANGVTWSPDNATAVSAHQDGTTWFWDISSGDAIRTLAPHNGWARGVAFSPDGRMLVTTGEDATADVWATDGWDSLARLRCPPQALWSVSWSPDGRFFAIGSGVYDSTVTSNIFIWEVSVGPSGD